MTKALFEYKTQKEQGLQRQQQTQQFNVPPGAPQPAFNEVLSMAKRLAVEEAPKHGFATVGEPLTLNAINRRTGSRLVNVRLNSPEARCQDSSASVDQCVAFFVFDSKNGKLFEWRILGQIDLEEQALGNFITRWLVRLHFGQQLGLAYKIFVSVLGIVIAMLSITGIYIWWKKRKARKYSNAKKVNHELASLESSS